MRRVHLFRWWKHTQVDIEWGGGFLSLGLDRRGIWKPIA